VMRELEGRSYQEIAEILSMSVSAVETLIFRARRALREQLEDGITCREAELAISRQLDGRLPRKQKGALRAHLRECAECAAFARSQRAQRGALKALGAIPLPSSLAGLFGGGGAATVGGGVAIKAALLGTGVVLATGAGYEGVRQGAFHHHAVPTAGVAKAHRPAATPQPPVVAATVVRVVREQARDQQPFRRAAVTAHRARRDHVLRAVPPGLAKPKPQPEHKEVSVLPPSRERAHDLKPTHVEKPPNQHGQGHGQGGSHGNGGGNVNGGGNASGRGNGNNGGNGDASETDSGPGNSGEHGKSGH